MLAIMLSIMLVSSTPPAADCVPVRDAKGNIKRNQAEIEKFKKANICPTRCKLYVREGSKFVVWKACGRCQVDHVCPLACCGSDKVENMEWLTVEENQAKGDNCITCFLRNESPPP